MRHQKHLPHRSHPNTRFQLKHTRSPAPNRSSTARPSTKPQRDASRAFLLALFNASTSLTGGNKSSAAQCQHHMELIQHLKSDTNVQSDSESRGFQLFIVLFALIKHDERPVLRDLISGGLETLPPHSCLAVMDVMRGIKFMRDFCWVTDMYGRDIWMLLGAKKHEGRG